MRKLGNNKLRGIHLIFAFIFLFALMIRIFASQNLPINSYEASILLNITGQINVLPDGISLFESLLIKASFFVFGESDLAARIWPILFGCLLIWTPLYLLDRIRTSAAVVLSILLAMDPFIIVNSIQIGSNIFAVFALINMIGSIWKNKKAASFISMFLLMISGRGFFFALLFCILLFITFPEFAVKTKEIISIRRREHKKGKTNSYNLMYLVFGMLFYFFIVLLKLDLSVVVSNFVQVFSAYFVGLIRGNTIFLGPILLFSYFPLLTFLFIIDLIFYWKNDIAKFRFLLIWISIILISLMINQYFLNLDLIWISTPILFFSLPLIKKGNTEFFIKNKILDLSILAFSICLISLSISGIALIYQGFYGFSQYSALISIISTLILIITLGIFISFNYGIKQSVLIFVKSFILFLVVIQIGFSYKASGLGGLHYLELLWEGDIADYGQIHEQIVMLNQTKVDVNEQTNIALLKYMDAEISWNLRDYEVEQFFGTAFPKDKFNLIISENEISQETSQEYYGRKIIRNAYPAWINEPFKNLFYTDYWSWLFFRRSALDKTYYYMYINAD